jgi:hypothetical protein
MDRPLRQLCRIGASPESEEHVDGEDASRCRNPRPERPESPQTKCPLNLPGERTIKWGGMSQAVRTDPAIRYREDLDAVRAPVHTDPNNSRYVARNLCLG